MLINAKIKRVVFKTAIQHKALEFFENAGVEVVQLPEGDVPEEGMDEKEAKEGKA